MSIKNGDLPAMPIDMTSPRFTAFVEYADSRGDRSSVNAMLGLTKREMFAMTAMQGLLSGVHGDSSLYDAAPEWVRNISEASAEFADALLAELEKSK